MARKDNSPAISFFSFQDIITSVTGIMFLVMLLLTLILLMRDMGGADTSAEDQAIRELKDSVRQLQEQLTRAANRSEELRRRLEELRKLDAKSLPVRRDELKRLIAQMEGDLARMAALQDTTVKQAEDTAAQALAIRETSKDEKKTLDEMLAEVAALTEQKKKLEDAAQKSQYVMRFTWRKRSAKKPLLVECSGKKHPGRRCGQFCAFGFL